VTVLGVRQFFRSILAEVGLEEGFRFRKSQMKACQRLDLELQRVSLDVEQVTTNRLSSDRKWKW
jgi:hypothetical protein